MLLTLIKKGQENKQRANYILYVWIYYLRYSSFYIFKNYIQIFIFIKKYIMFQD